MKDIFSLQNKTVVVTGATGFFGSYFTKGLLDFGAKVILVDKTEAVDKMVKELKSEYGEDKVEGYAIDLYDTAKAKELYEKIAEQENVSGLVNNAFDFSLKTGFNDDSGRIENATYEQLLNSFNSGIYWQVLATQIFGKKMKNNKGSIVNICSMYSVISPDYRLYEGTDKFNPPGYGIAKAALLQFTRYTASFFAPNVRANAILPGAFPNLETKTYNAVGEDEKEFLERLDKKTLLGRTGHPKELVGALIYLISDASSYVTGQGITVDGGWTAI